jgi:hypothetical protein
MLETYDDDCELSAFFEDVCLNCPEDLNIWKELFPDPSESLAIHTQSLSLHNAEQITDEDAIRIKSEFINVKRLELRVDGRDSSVPVIEDSSHKFSSTVRSLSLSWNELQFCVVFDFIHSFSQLEELHIDGRGGECNSDTLLPLVSDPLPLPESISTLVLKSKEYNFMVELADPPSPHRFRKIVWQRGQKSYGHKMDGLVRSCSDTLEYLEIDCRTSAKSHLTVPY